MPRPRSRNYDPNDPVNVVSDLYNGIANDVPTGDSNVEWHPWQDTTSEEDDQSRNQFNDF